MTDLTFNSSMVSTPPRAGKARRATLTWSKAWSNAVRLAMGMPVTLLLMVPDNEVHAKLFKAGMILNNLHQRIWMSVWA